MIKDMSEFLDLLENFEQLGIERIDDFEGIKKNVFSIQHAHYCFCFDKLTKEIGFVSKAPLPHFIVQHWNYAKKANEYNIYDIKQDKFIFKHWYDNLIRYSDYRNIYCDENQMQQINLITLKGDLLSDIWFDGYYDFDRHDCYLYSQNGFKGYAYIFLTKTLNKNEIY